MLEESFTVVETMHDRATLNENQMEIGKPSVLSK